jgi:YD repeat-containing protein
MQYDDDGRLTQEVWLQGSTAVETLTYAYDEDGNLTQAGNHLGTATFSYDEDSRLSGTTDPFGRSLAFTLDEDGNRLAVTDSLG